MATATSAPTAAMREKSFLASAMGWVWAIAFAKLLVHIYFNNRYGYFIDEFDYMACGEHPAWGYVDQPPLIPFLIHISRFVLGDSLRAVRFIPALASSLLVVQTAVLAREFGGRRFALILSAISIVVVPQYLSNAGLLGTNCLEPNLWLACAYFVVLAVRRNDPRYWLGFGMFAGLGMEEKYTIAVFVFGIFVGLLLTEQRRAFLNKWIWLAAAAGFLLFLPNLLWNMHNDWPFLQLIRAIRAEGRDVVLGPFAFFFQQILIVNPLTAPIWLAGLFGFLFSARLQAYRCLGYAYLVTYTGLFVQHGKNYYLSPIYPMLFAAGAVVLEAALDQPEGDRSRVQWVKPAAVTVLLLSGVFLAPIVIPVFSPEHFLAYTKFLPFKLPVMEHAHARAALPQWYSDQFGWKEIADEAAVAWNRIPAEERADCGIFGQNYGQAGAIDFFYGRQGLPPAMSGDRSYFLWGPHGYSGNCMVVLDDRKEVLQRYWERVEFVGTSAENPWSLARPVDVFICKEKKFSSWTDVWPRLKRWR